MKLFYLYLVNVRLPTICVLLYHAGMRNNWKNEHTAKMKLVSTYNS